MEGDQPGVTPDAPAGTGEAPATPPAQGSQPPVGDDVTSTGNGNQEQTVPFGRFQEVNDKAKAAEERAAEAERKLAEAEAAKQPSPSDDEDDDDIDPSVQKLVTKIIENQGYVKKDDVQKAVQQSELARQYKEDVSELTSKYAKTTVPFVEKDVRDFAKENGINITSKNSLDAAYKQMNFDKLTEAAKNAAITAFKEGGKNTGERPGSTGAQPPQEPEVHGLKNRIAAARSRL